MTLLERRESEAKQTRAEALEAEARRQSYGDKYGETPTDGGLPSILVRLAGRAHRQARWA